MSGSSERSYTGITSKEVSCENLVFETQLASPKEEVVAQLKRGDILDVHLDQLSGMSVVQALWNGHVAGGIASPQVQRLLACLREGSTYAAEVISVLGGQVKVRIFPRLG
jgi:hypothetical protein